MKGNLFIWCLLALQTGAAIVYFAHGDWKHGTYWLFATGLNMMVTVL